MADHELPAQSPEQPRVPRSTPPATPNEPETQADAERAMEDMRYQLQEIAEVLEAEQQLALNRQSLTPEARRSLQADAALVEKRVSIIEKLTIQGLDKQSIWRNVSERWGISYRQYERYLQKATENIRKAASIDRDLELSIANSRYNKIFLQAMTGKQRNLHAAIRAEKERTVLLGLVLDPDAERAKSTQDIANEIRRQQSEMEQLTLGYEEPAAGEESDTNAGQEVPDAS